MEGGRLVDNLLPANRCMYLAHTSDNFSRVVYESWGVGGICFLTIPCVLTAVMLFIFAEEVHYIMLKSNSKDLRNSLLWILGTYPAIMFFGLIGIFVPRSVAYLSFMYQVYVAFATYKYYYLVMVFSGGTIPFVEKTRHKEVALNVVPCCCICCLPKIHNTVRTTEVAKWMIFQNVILTPFYGGVATLLKTDWKLISTDGISPSVYISALNGLSTIVCIYGFNLIQRMTKSIEGMNASHAIKGKTSCFQLIMLITGLESVFFNVLAQLGLFPCVPPLNFNSRRIVIMNYSIVLQAFFVGIMARRFYRRKEDILRQHTLTDDVSIGPEIGGNKDLSPNYNGVGTAECSIMDSVDSASQI